MKKIDYTQEEVKIQDNTKIIDREVDTEMKKSFIAYAMAVNVSRAIPDVRDGLKPVHRRILYAMGEMGLFGDKPFKKCARIVGDVMGKYHPHGDSAIYDALVRLAQDFSINCPLVEGHGNFGSVDGDSAAASRYTEARLSKITSEMLRDINKNTVDFRGNYDDSEQEPTVLPSKFPNLLVNGSDGIAVGMATNIPPHNLAETINGVIALIDNPDITIDELIKIIPCPDFPTGGILLGAGRARNAYRTGRGNIVLRAKTEIEEIGDTGKSRIVVTELPYQVNKAKLIISIADMIKDKRIEGIQDLRDESDLNGMRFIIDIKKDFNPQVILNILFKHTQLQISDGIIMLALVDGTPKILNLKEILFYYLRHQFNIITKRTIYDKQKAEERSHILEGLLIALNNIDEVIATIKQSKDKTVATENLINKYGLTNEQAVAILDMRLQRLTGLEVAKLNEELASLIRDIAEYNAILTDKNKVYAVIRKELVEIRDKYGVPRKTEIQVDYSDFDIADFIEEEKVVITMTHGGYIKRMSVSEYHSQKRGGVGVNAHKTKEEDFVENMITTSSHSELLFFTNFGKVYCLKAFEVPEASKQAKGRAIVNLLQIDAGEKVNAIIEIENRNDGNLIMATKNGIIKKTAMSEFERIRKTGKIAISLFDDDNLISVQVAKEHDEVLVASSEGKCIRFDESAIRSTGRLSHGVRCMRFKKGEKLVDMIIVRKDSEILTITSKGYGKRSDISEYRLQGRGGKGIMAGVFTEQTGNLVAMKNISSTQDVILITNNGTMIRTPSNGISHISRRTKGVKVMRNKDGEEIVCVAITEHEEEQIDESEIELNEQLPNDKTLTSDEDTFKENDVEENVEEFLEDDLI